MFKKSKSFAEIFYSLKVIAVVFALCSVHLNGLAQTFNFNSWSAGSFSYSNTQGGNTMSVTYSESANNRAQTLASTTCFGNPTTTPNIPFYYNESTMNIANYSSGSCYCSSSPSQSGLVLAANWANNNNTNYEQIVISFANPVCSPVSFNIWDINQDIWSGDGSTYFTDKIDISATDASSNPIAAGSISIGSCGGNSVSTSGNTKTITASGTGCGCGATSVSISAQVKTITIKYYPGGSTYSTNPWSQYVIISSITATAPPTASINAAALTCGSSTTTLTASTNAGSPTYLWTGPGGSTITNPTASSTSVTGAGTYTLTINPGGCSSTATYTLTPTGTAPNLTATASQTVNCTSSTISASSSDPVTYSWSGPGIVSGGSTSTPTVNTSGTYTVTVTNTSTGCTNSADVMVTANTTPPTAVGGSALALNCTNTSGTISVSTNAGAPTYLWSGPGIVSGGTSASPTVNAAGTYSVTVTNTANGCTNTATVSVTNNNTSPTAVGGSALALNCTSTSGTISVSTNAGSPTYLWSGPGIVSGGTSASPTVNAAGTYSVTVTNTANGCTNTATVSVTNNNTPPTAVGGSALALNCTSTSGTISVSTNAGSPTYLWSGPGIVSGGTSASPTVNAAGTYSVTVTNTANGCTNTATVSVTNNNTPPTAVGGSALALSCTNTSGTISVSTNAGSPTYLWSGPGIVSGGTSASPTVNTAGTYSVTVTNTANGCTNTATVSVTNNNTPPTAVGGSALALNCTSTSGTISVSTNAGSPTYLWSGPGIVSGGTSSSPTVNAAGTYSVTVTNTANGCTNTATVSVTNNSSSPNVNPGSDQTLSCIASNVTLSATSSTPGASFAWTNSGGAPAGTTPAQNSTDVSSQGTYTVTVTDPSNGCTATATIQVNANTSAPDISTTLTAEITCVSSSVIIQGSSTTPNVTYLWTDSNGNAAGNTPGLNQTEVSTADVYTLTVSDPNSGCSSSQTVTVSINQNAPDLTSDALVNIGCSNSSAILSASSGISGASFVWTDENSNPAGSTPSLASTEVSTPGVYTVTVTDPSNGCTASSQVNVVQSNAPIAAAGNDMELTCNSTSVNLDASGSDAGPGITYTWSGPGIVSGSTSTNPLVDQPGTYTITVTDSNTGCETTDEVVVTLNTTPPFANAGSDQSITCTSSSVSLDASSSSGNAITFSWTGPSITGDPTQSITTADQPGVYTVLVTDGLTGCTSTANVTVVMDTIPPVADAGMDAVISCLSGNVMLQSLSSGLSYAWSGPGIVSGANTDSPTVNSNGEYILVVTGTNGCQHSDTVNVTSPTGPVADFSATPLSGSVPLNVSTSNNSSGNSITNFWDFGNGITSTLNEPGTTYNAGGTYEIVLVVTDANGCTDTARVQIEANGIPIDVPNGFTPNNDGKNDYFVIVGLLQYPNNKITIFNRWGDPVFSAEPYLNNWDGSSSNAALKLNGDKVVDGTYFFILDLGDGSEPINGFVEMKTK